MGSSRLQNLLELYVVGGVLDGREHVDRAQRLRAQASVLVGDFVQRVADEALDSALSRINRLLKDPFRGITRAPVVGAA